MGDALWIGVASIDGPDTPALNVFRKNGNEFELVKIIEGKEACDIYDALTKGGSLDADVAL